MTAAEKAIIVAVLSLTIEPARWAATELARADSGPYRADVHQAAALVNTGAIERAIAAVMRIEVEG